MNSTSKSFDKSLIKLLVLSTDLNILMSSSSFIDEFHNSGSLFKYHFSETRPKVFVPKSFKD